MKIAVAILLLTIGAAVAELSFDAYLAKFNKAYSGAEYAKRKAIYENKLKDIAAHKAEYKAAGMEPWKGVTMFSDMTTEEFKNSGRVMRQKLDAGVVLKSCMAKGVEQPEVPSDIPASYDWRDAKPAVISPVQDQQQCGSCWAFSTTSAVESAYAIKTGKLNKLSEQEIVDCSHACTLVANSSVCNQGCDGGFMWTAMYDIVQWKGQASEKAYPYTAETGKCKRSGKTPYDPITNYTCLTGPDAAPVDEKKMAAFLVANGPLSIAFDASALESYTSGIIVPTKDDCTKTSLDHAVNVVGYGTANNTDFWIVRNSWNENWGEEGYFRIQRGTGACGINTAVVFPIV